jgi:hypothetical protein
MTTFGYPINNVTINNSFGKLAGDISQWAFECGKMHAPIANLGGDDEHRIAALMTLGFTDIDDATEALRIANVLWTPAAIYYGQAVQPEPYNYDNEFSKLWGVRG